MASGYPEKHSVVVVIFTSGEVKEYAISTGSGIARYLAQQAASTGLLVLLDGKSATTIPLVNVQEYTLRELTEEEAAAKKAGA